MDEPVTIIEADSRHAKEIAQIYNQGIANRTATFETTPKTAKEICDWFSHDLPFKVALTGDAVAGFARVSGYRERACYAGIKEYSVYVDDRFQGRGVGQNLLSALVKDCRKNGVWKLLSRIFPENTASIKIAKNLGFRVVGTYRNHGKLDGVWKDCVIVELSL